MRILGKNSCYNFDNEKLFHKSKYSKSYIGIDENTNNRVFIKELIHNLDELNQVSQFQINYPLIAPLDWLIDHDSAYIIYPFIEGFTLKNLIEKSPKISLEEKKNIIINSLRAVDLLHKQGIIHGDIHPGNILINQENIYLTDNGTFFLAGRKSHEKAFNLLYAAPEQILKQNHLWSFKTDWFNWGMSIYHFINKSHPFIHSNPNFTIQMMLNIPLEPLPKTYGDLGKLLNEICKKPNLITSPSKMSQSDISLAIQENIKERIDGTSLMNEFENLNFKRSIWDLLF